MSIRIQPREIDVPEDDPFKNDLLGREQTAMVLTRLLGSIDGSCVVAVDAAWGFGKTTFLKIWSQQLRNNDFRVVEFNAWETDVSSDPFVSISSELMSQLPVDSDGTLSQKVKATKDAAVEIAVRALPGAIRLLTAGVLDLTPVLEKELGQAISSFADDRLAHYQEMRHSVEGFKTSLQDMATTIASSSEMRPLVLVIDELDRCRPSYAIELLEVAKHLFSVDHIVFILAVNRAELAHSIKAVYGQDFDAQGYLRRIFDLDFRLATSDRGQFIESVLYANRLDDSADSEAIRKVLSDFFSSSDLSLRTIAQAIHRLGLVYASLPSNKPFQGVAAAVAVILRTTDMNL